MSHVEADTPKHPPALPLAVHIGFAGARFLRPGASALDDAVIEQAVLEQLRAVLARLPATLGLSPQHFLVGVSQMAAGADALFGQAVEQLGWGHRVVLPQLRDDYLQAIGTGGVDDFTPRQRIAATERLESPAVIEERVVSTAATRAERFDDANLAILTSCDVLVCLVNESLPGRAGGTRTLVDRAARHGVPVLYLGLLADEHGRPRIVAQPLTAPLPMPTLPQAFAQEPEALAMPADRWPDAQAYAKALKGVASRHAGERRRSFGQMAEVIVWSHVGATILASVVLKLSQHRLAAVALLALELALLAWGFWTHRRLHAGAHAETWAVTRLCAEIARSALAAGRLRPALDHLLELPVPAALGPMLRTLVVLNLRDIRRAGRAVPWGEARDDYVAHRLAGGGGSGQIAYYRREQLDAEKRGATARRLFHLWSALAIGATFVKLAFEVASARYGVDLHWSGGVKDVLGIMAIVLPVVAVAVMSLAAAFDAEGRAHVFEEMHHFLKRQHGRITHAQSAREAALLVSETETRLLGETLSWFSRRAYTSIA